jgi:hypothetical protein
MQSKYRIEYWEFRTPKGVERKAVCVTAGGNERARLLKKAEQMAKNNGWILR